MTVRFRGDHRRPTASEINRWNAAAQPRPQHRPGFPTVQQYDPNSRTVFVKNISGNDRDRFETMAVSGLVWELATDGTADVIFEAGTAAANAAPLILLEPIADEAIGRAIIDGVSLALVGGGTGTFAVPDDANHRLKPDSGGTIRLLIPPHATETRLLPVVLNSATGSTGIAVTPTDGIPGRTGAGTTVDPWVWGSASCTVVGDDGVESVDNITVYNMVASSIDGDEVIQWKNINGKPFVDVEDC